MKIDFNNKARIDFNFFDIYQNTALSVIAIQSFILGYYKVAINKDDKINFPPLKYAFFILPIIYDTKTMSSIKNELYTTLTQNKEFTLDLQDKACKMSSQTFEALNLGFSKGIFNLDSEKYYLELNEDFMKEFTIKLKFSNDVISDIQKYSKRLGGIFAKKDEKKLQIELNIFF